jgi:hypothetical protein
MAGVRYSTENVPAIGAGAFMPVLSAVVSPKASTYGLVRITGHPGNLPVPSPRPAALPAGPLVRSAQPSYNSPDTIYPSQYYTHVSDMHPANNTVRVRSTNEVPVPARQLVQQPLVAYRRPRYGGIRQVTWPPAPMAWQNINQGAAGG